jgi:hypothetical protein
MNKIYGIIMAALLTGCGTGPCKSGTVRVNVQMDNTVNADKLVMEMTVGETTTSGSLPLMPGTRNGAFDVAFPAGYPVDEMLTLVVKAMKEDAMVGKGEGSVTLTETCASMALFITGTSQGSDLSTTPDLASADSQSDGGQPDLRTNDDGSTPDLGDDAGIQPDLSHPDLVKNDGADGGGNTPDLTPTPDLSPLPDLRPPPPVCNDAMKNGAETDVDCGGGVCALCADGKGCAKATDCTSFVCAGNKCAAPACNDNVQNGQEPATDCGDGCPLKCADGKTCRGDTDCASSVCAMGQCAAPTCLDKVKNDGETDQDCGGAMNMCPRCLVGQSCLLGGDCIGGVCSNLKCSSAQCNDTVKNGSETDSDCGGGTCPKCAEMKACVKGTDCVSGVCFNGACKAPACGDTVKNGSETDTDCGGGCPKCVDGKDCVDPKGTDCVSGVCKAGTCQAPTCSDTVKNGMETDLDCGGSCPMKCSVDKGCAKATDCASGVCAGGKCSAPTCMDGNKNGAETDVDCGGGCNKCTDGKGCGQPIDCMSGVCKNSVCQAPTCMDSAKNGPETDTDCGGNCPKCTIGKTCKDPGDCQTNVCTTNVCAAAPSCNDGQKNQDETDVDCGGTKCGKCADGKACAINRDCQSKGCDAADMRCKKFAGAFTIGSGGPGFSAFDHPVVYSCLEACVKKFGGNVADYGCSTTQADLGMMNHKAWVICWEDPYGKNCHPDYPGGPTPVSESFKRASDDGHGFTYWPGACSTLVSQSGCEGEVNYCYIK